VGEKEGLYRVSVKNNKVQMATLRKWNKLTSDNISTGQKLIVGYIQATGIPASQPAMVASAPPAQAPPVQQPAASAVTPPANTNTTVQARSEPPRQEPPRQEPPASKPAPAATTPKPAATATTQKTLSVSGSGYFKNQFELQSRNNNAGKDQTVNGGVFKTTSGWQDGKYYALMDGVEPGTIIRVVNPSNSKVVFAKVLGEMSGIRQNTGLDVRISNAAASALEIGEQDKFVVKVNY
jgi:LysM repeat protein